MLGGSNWRGRGAQGRACAHNHDFMRRAYFEHVLVALLVCLRGPCAGVARHARCGALCARLSGVCSLGGTITGWRGRTAQTGLQSVTRASPAWRHSREGLRCRACHAQSRRACASGCSAPRGVHRARGGQGGRARRLIQRGSPRGAHICSRSARRVPEGDMRRRFRAGLTPSPPAQQKAACRRRI